MDRTWGIGLVVSAGLVGGSGCAGTDRPALFHRNRDEQPCPPGVSVPVSEGPILDEMPAMPAPVGQPGMVMPPGTVTIPGPGMTVPPATTAPPPVGPVPRTAPAPQVNPVVQPGKPQT